MAKQSATMTRTKQKTNEELASQLLPTRKISDTRVQSLTSRIKEVDDDSAKLAEICLSRRPYHEKLKHLQHEIKESVRDVEFNYQIQGFFEDACYALHRAVENFQGFTKMEDKKQASGGDQPPSMIDVRFADGKRIKVPYGSINLPVFGPNSHISMQYRGDTLFVSGVCQNKFTKLMDEIIETAQHILRTDSIYCNQAIKYSGDGSPEFMDLSRTDEIPLFLTESAQYSTEPIEVRITDAATCKKNGIDLKFGVLLEGNYGTGKTLYAQKLALKAIQHGWTFIYCSKPEATLEVLKTANKFTDNGTGVVLFIEDIDKILNNRDNTTNEISLLMDGSETKHNNIISIFSTNHVENIDPTFLRGKRIGSIVTLSWLDAMTAEKMIHHLLGDMLDGSCTKAAQEVEDAKIVPAFLSEIIDRVKTHSILRKGALVTEKDLMNAIKQFKRQMEIATVKVNNETDDEIITRLKAEKLNNIVGKAVADSHLGSSLRGYLDDQGY